MTIFLKSRRIIVSAMKNAQDVVDTKVTTQIDVDTLTGNAEELFDSVQGKSYNCCGSVKVDNPNIYAYGHSDGSKLANGGKLWMMVKCPKCGYKLSHPHWETNI